MMFDFVKTTPADETVKVEGYFAVSPSQMFNAWTNPEIIKKWFGPEPNSLSAAEIDLRKGGSWRFLASDDGEKTVAFEGEYLEIEQDLRLVFSWSHAVTFANGKKETTPASRVEVLFSSQGSGTFVVVQHSAIRTADGRKGVGGGWEGSFGNLKSLVETR